MEIKENTVNGFLVLAVEGRLDANSSAAFQERLLAEVARRPNARVILDLAPLNYLSSAGLRVLLVAAKTAKPGTPEFRAALRDAFETMGRTVLAHGVLDWTAADHWGYTNETGVMLKVVDGKFKVEQ